MSQPKPYSPQHAFVSDSATLANFPGQQLDVEFQSVKATTDAVRANLALIQRDDGALANNSVSYDQLSVSLQSAGLQPAIAWSTGITFAIGANVIQGGSLYRSLVAHTAGVFATDLAAGKWVLVGALVAGTNGTNGTNGSNGTNGTNGAAGAGYGGTSTTSLLIANSVTKLFATQAGLAYQVGNYVRASSAANGANYMEGTVTTYAGTSLTIAVTAISGSGTFADWSFAISGAPGSIGVATIAGNNGAFTLSNGITNATNDIRLDVSYVQNFLAGLGLANGADAVNDIDISPGVAADSTNAALVKLSSSLTKQLDAAWAVGTNQGGLDTGTIANTTYHVWLIQRSDTGVVDALFSTSATAPTMPTNYDRKRRIGSIIRASAAIVLFTQKGDLFLRSATAADLNATTPGSTNAASITLGVPVGIEVRALFHTRLDYVSTTTGILWSSLNESDQVPAAGLSSATVNSTATISSQNQDIMTNTSEQVRLRANGVGCSTSAYTYGWIDTRGK